MSDVVMRLLLRAAFAWACAVDDQLVAPGLEALMKAQLGECAACERCNPKTPGVTSATGSTDQEGNTK